MQVLRRGMNGIPQDIVAGADSLLETPAINENRWPYSWLEPRFNTQYKQPVASIAIPAISANFTEVLALKVPSGFRFVLRSIMHTFQSSIAGQFVDGSGELLWTINVDQPVGIPNFSGFGLPDLSNMAEQRGSLRDGPWQLEGYTVYDAYQIIRYNVRNVSSGAAGAPNFTTCGLFGWLEPLLDTSRDS